MTRNEFMKCGAACACSGAALVMLEPGAAQAAEPETVESEQTKRKLEAARYRFARLSGVLDHELDDATRNKVWESLGRDHAREIREITAKYKGNVEGFLDLLRGHSLESAEYDAQAGTIRVVYKSGKCVCPLVEAGKTSPNFCDCTLGWQKEVYAAVSGQRVQATLE